MLGEEGIGSYCLMATQLFLGVMKKFWKELMMMLAQHCEYLMTLNCPLLNG